MQVLLQCIGHDDAAEFFVAYTDIDGQIGSWLLFGCQSGALRIVDTDSYHHIRISFDTQTYFGKQVTPWYDISADIDLVGRKQHSIHLQFGPGPSEYHLKCTSITLQCYHTEEELEVINKEIATTGPSGACAPKLSLDRPSHLYLESPLLPCPGTKCLLPQDVVGQGNKRKASDGHDDGPPRKWQILDKNKLSRP